MNEQLFYKVKKEYFAFRKELENNINNFSDIRILNNKECYLIKENWNNILLNIITKYEKIQQRNKCGKIPLPKNQPQLIHDISSVKYCIQNNYKLKLVSKNLINLLYRENLNNYNNIHYSAGNNKIIIEYKQKEKENEVLLIINPLQDICNQKIYTFTIKNINPDKMIIYKELLNINENDLNLKSYNIIKNIEELNNKKKENSYNNNNSNKQSSKDYKNSKKRCISQENINNENKYDNLINNKNNKRNNFNLNIENIQNQKKLSKLSLINSLIYDNNNNNEILQNLRAHKTNFNVEEVKEKEENNILEEENNIKIKEEDKIKIHINNKNKTPKLNNKSKIFQFSLSQKDINNLNDEKIKEKNVYINKLKEEKNILEEQIIIKNRQEHEMKVKYLNEINNIHIQLNDKENELKKIQKLNEQNEEKKEKRIRKLENKIKELENELEERTKQINNMPKDKNKDIEQKYNNILITKDNKIKELTEKNKELRQYNYEINEKIKEYGKKLEQINIKLKEKNKIIEELQSTNNELNEKNNII